MIVETSPWIMRTSGVGLLNGKADAKYERAVAGQRWMARIDPIQLIMRAHRVYRIFPWAQIASISFGLDRGLTRAPSQDAVQLRSWDSRYRSRSPHRQLAAIAVVWLCSMMRA